MKATAHMDCPGCGSSIAVNVDYPEPAPPYDPEYFTYDNVVNFNALGNAILNVPVINGERWLIQRIVVSSVNQPTQTTARVYVGRTVTSIADVLPNQLRDLTYIGNGASMDYPHFLYARSHDVISVVWTGGTPSVGTAALHIQYRLWREGG